ncbi:copper metallochaperone ATX1 ASCRUDRAFT_77172 [Ascoidea rubescens DSM 1968]|uniref:HMA domain-containing protein n=1 Tax=Ascoidea rubescens DSM 1968 TaxID=1344418 RepID=A0A1D2VCS9_9ASCO|nr:hypothetical protein ASCRUDRAFT_77172 [Ascoidea rubescens DSM 1968]ODV59436.1 hypothetical protein ASCRUDRAFT_77172 [Ascoidea rubescens DSM 1968]
MGGHQYEFNVKMACSGCSNAVSKAVSRLEGVQNVQTDLEKQLVEVKTGDDVSYDAVYNKISKTGKEILGGKVVF